ncbi:MAG: T9SS type A sorting domain-containing protein [Thermaurantimonas sp.]|uniref:T9SS type A sorting domain-containing protein n=1 Tax=Thermaurantimonas sp. TaxID=2681568 RepID=UPI00391D0E37
MRLLFALSSLIISTSLQAQILHTTVTPNVIDRDTLLLIDLDQDTVPDFAIRTQFNRMENNAVYDVISVTPLGQQGHRVAGTTPTVFPYASRFGFNEFIGPETPFLNPEIEGGMSFVRNGQFLFNDPWNGGATDEFLGFALRKNGNTHYGWAKVDVGNDGKSVTLKEFAVNLTPSAPINTNRFFSIPENPLRDLVIWQSSGMVYLRLPENQGRVEVQLTDIQGRILRSEYFFGTQHSIPMNLPTGVYLLLVKKDNVYVTRKIQYSPVWH